MCKKEHNKATKLFLTVRKKAHSKKVEFFLQMFYKN